LKRLFIYSFLLFSFYVSQSKAVVRDVVESFRVVRINSVSQRIISLNKIIFEENVEVLVDQNVHIWADRVEADKEKQFIEATAAPFGFVKLETPDFLMLADKIYLDLDKKTGYADNVKIQMDQRYISAKKAEKRDEFTWKLSDLVYTPCDHPSPHWHLHADEAKLYKYVIKGKGISLRVKNIPVFLIPKIVIPAQAQSKSGFLVPKFTLDKKLGFGLTQEYYWEIRPRMDTTLGVNWKNKKGYVFYDEFRWGRNNDDYTLVNTKFAKEYQAYVEEDFKIISKDEWRTSIQAKHFQPLKFKNFKIDNLVNVDFGSDKRIGYDFLGLPDSVEDKFYNSFISRWHSKNNGLIFAKVDRDKVFREDFTFSNTSKFELDERMVRSRVPHFEWNSNFYSLSKFAKYKHDLFVDYANLSRKIIFKTIVGNDVVSSYEPVPFENFSTLRLFYEGVLENYLKFKRNIIRIALSPNIQFRSKSNYITPYVSTNRSAYSEIRLDDQCAARALLQGDAEWAFPEFTKIGTKSENDFFFQPVLTYKFIPKIKQDDWGFIDEWDRIYPNNKIGLELRNNWYFRKGCAGLTLGQAYDFYKSPDLFYLDRAIGQNHLMPFKVDFSYEYDFFRFNLLQQYDMHNFTIFDNEAEASINFKNFDAHVGWVFQSRKEQVIRQLLSNVPSFYLFGFSMQANKAMRISYEGQFFSPENSLISLFQNINALCHRLDVKLNGHCWGISFGLQEKRYRQQGIVRSERGFVFSFKLESLGSFGGRFKPETKIIEAPEDYY